MLTYESLLRIPYAIDQAGNKVSPDKAEKDNDYFCPECKSKLIFRKGKKVRAHFAHYHVNNQCNLLNEGWIHLSAKYQIKKQLEEWINGSTSSPILCRTCPICKKTKEQKFPLTVQKVTFEKQVDGCRIDVALCDKSGNILCAIEVKDTHDVDEKKIDKLTIPWIEVEAEEILRGIQKWKVVQEGNLKLFRCKCWKAVEMKTVQRGLALHVDYCPINKRIWKGKPYANFIDDCSCCEYLVAHLQDFEYNSYVFCSGYNVKPHPKRKQVVIDKKRQKRDKSTFI